MDLSHDASQSFNDIRLRTSDTPRAIHTAAAARPSATHSLITHPPAAHLTLTRTALGGCTSREGGGGGGGGGTEDRGGGARLNGLSSMWANDSLALTRATRSITAAWTVRTVTAAVALGGGGAGGLNRLLRQQLARSRARAHTRTHTTLTHTAVRARAHASTHTCAHMGTRSHRAQAYIFYMPAPPVSTAGERGKDMQDSSCSLGTWRHTTHSTHAHAIASHVTHATYKHTAHTWHVWHARTRASTAHTLACAGTAHLSRTHTRTRTYTHMHTHAHCYKRSIASAEAQHGSRCRVRSRVLPRVCSVTPCALIRTQNCTACTVQVCHCWVWEVVWSLLEMRSFFSPGRVCKSALRIARHARQIAQSLLASLTNRNYQNCWPHVTRLGLFARSHVVYM